MTQLAAAEPGRHEAQSPVPDGQPIDAVTSALNAWLEIDLDALASNLAALRAAVAPAELIAVVKANAYGAGAGNVALALEAAGVRRFAVAWAAEAVDLRRAGVQASIIVLGHSNLADAATAVEHGITLTCDSLALAEALSAAAVVRGTVAPAHIHVDTGLHRDGVTPEEAVPLANAMRALPGIEVEGLSTHMANADETDDSFSLEQQARFEAVFRELEWINYRHTANSATALRHPEFRFDGVRVGLALHGIAPDNTPSPGLRPILQLKARIARVVEAAPGEGVSYGLTWTAKRQSRLALIPVGYADGWRRALSNRGQVLVGGQRCPMVGRVCMDQFLVDITDISSDVQAGDEAVLIGRQGRHEISANDVARTLDTVPWEVISGMQARPPRLYVRGGVVDSRG
jgi:alanine racemase